MTGILGTGKKGHKKIAYSLAYEEKWYSKTK